jgi:Arc/MetJ-type ribon-helix-helix transcriptional regulator
MTIHLPPNIESSIQAAVQSGQFASLDEAMTEAATLLVQRLEQKQAQVKRPAASTTDLPDPLLGLMADHAELMDEIVEDAMRHREQQPWRITTGE